MYQVKLYIIVRIPDDDAKNELKAVDRAKESVAKDIENLKIKEIREAVNAWFSSEVKKTL